MTLKEAVKILEAHNIWRRGSDDEPTDPKQLGIAIDVIVKHLKENEKAAE